MLVFEIRILRSQIRNLMQTDNPSHRRIRKSTYMSLQNGYNLTGISLKILMTLHTFSDSVQA